MDNPKDPTRQKEFFVIGVTGSMGSGKSSLMKIVSSLGFETLSADELAREAVSPGSVGLETLIRTFGASLLDPNGTLNRKKLRALIAESPQSRLQVETTLHPIIQDLFTKRKEEVQHSGKPILFYEAPLLFEAGAEKRVDYVICVTAKEDLRLGRVMGRDGGSIEQAKKLMDSQMAEEEKIKASDFEIPNNGSESELKQNFHKALQDIEQRFGRSFPTTS
jgi:dephospho-CoA kinase